MEKEMKTVLVGFASSSPGRESNGEHYSNHGPETKFSSSFCRATSIGLWLSDRSTMATTDRRIRSLRAGTMTTIKSNSTKGGGGSNELRFEDKKGSEEIFLHGQKDWRTVVEHDQYETIGNNKTVEVGGNRTETIGKAQTLTIGAASQVTVGAAMNETIGSDKQVQVSGTVSEAVGRDLRLTIGNDERLTIGKNFTLSAGNGITVEVQKTVSISAVDELTLKCGQAAIILKKNGDISITGKEISIKGSGDVIIKGQRIIQN